MAYKYFLVFYFLFLPNTSSLYAERPMIVDDPIVVPFKKFSIEIGNHFDFLNRARHPSKYVNWLDVILLYGLYPDMEISLNIPYAFVFYTPESSKQTDFSYDNPSLALKYVVRNVDNLWGVGIEGRIFLPEISKTTIASNHSSMWINTMGEYMQWNILLRLSAGYLINFSKQKSDWLLVGSCIRTTYNNPFFGFIEAVGEIPLDSASSAIYSAIQIGGGYEVSTHTVLDFGLLVGLTDSAQRLSFTVGGTFLF